MRNPPEETDRVFTLSGQARLRVSEWCQTRTSWACYLSIDRWCEDDMRAPHWKTVEVVSLGPQDLADVGHELQRLARNL
jgi:hypothetical protein